MRPVTPEEFGSARRAELPAVWAELDRATPRALGRLCEWLRIPSISAAPERRRALERAAGWLADALEAIGFGVTLVDTAGPPVVLGEWRKAGPAAPTILVYGHYDVQAVEPLDAWESPPFEPGIRDGRIYGRGATDNKGQLFAHLAAIDAWVSVTGGLPVNVVLFVEGEEEIGSPNLQTVIEAYGEFLRADAVVISDGPMFAPGLPTIETSLRGYLGLQIDVHGPARDLHSGEYGGAVVNPANVLCRIIASLHDPTGRIAVAGFYDGVCDVSEARRAAFESLPFSEAAFQRHAGMAALGGEAGFSTLERLWTRPACDVSGLRSGYTGDGNKSVIPASASAKIGFRLVSGQRPDDIEQRLTEHVLTVCPHGVTVRITRLACADAWAMPEGISVIEAASRAARLVFDRDPVFVGGGGSIPVVPMLARSLHVPVLLFGLGQPGENAHAANEWFSLEHLRLGARMSAALWAELSMTR